MTKRLLVGVSSVAMMVMMASTASAQVNPGQPPRDNPSSFYVVNPGIPNPPPPGSNYSEIEQNEDGNDAEIDQTGASGPAAANYGRIVQGRTGADSDQNNRARLDQDGTGQQAYIEQVSSPFDNTANVQAQGEPTNFGFGSTSSLFTSDIATPAADLAGARNNVEVNQEDGAGTGGNQVIVQQGSTITGFASGGGAYNSTVFIDQSGTTNLASVQQGGGDVDNDGNNQSRIGQTGTNNTAENRQGEADRSRIFQTGTGNEAYVDQTPQADPAQANQDAYGRQSYVAQNGDTNFTQVTQNGSRNTSAVLQGDDGTLAGGGTGDPSNANRAEVTQNGQDGFSQVIQGVFDVAGVTTNSDNTARVVQEDTAERENAYVQQGNTGNTTDVRQAGEGDSAVVNQFGQNGVIEVWQGVAYPDASRNNVAYVDQEATAIGTPGAGTPFAGVYQNGESNTADVTQRNGPHYTFVTQGRRINGGGETPSTFNVATVTQEGAAGQGGQQAVVTQGYDLLSNNNTATVEQTLLAHRAYAVINQDGNENGATIRQETNDVAAYIVQRGNNNTATINQTVNANATNLITQNGNNNTSTINN